MIEIAKCAGIPFTPDPNVMREDEVAAAEQMLIDFKNHGGVVLLSHLRYTLLFLFYTCIIKSYFQQGYGWMYPGGSRSDNKKPPSVPPPNDGSG